MDIYVINISYIDLSLQNVFDSSDTSCLQVYLSDPNIATNAYLYILYIYSNLLLSIYLCLCI